MNDDFDKLYTNKNTIYSNELILTRYLKAFYYSILKNK